MMNKLTLAVVAALSAGVISTAVLADPPPTYHPGAKENQSAKHALDRQLPKIDFNAVTLSDAIDFLSNTTEANISVDWKELEKASIAKDTPITMKLSAQQPLHTVLNLMLRQAGGTGVLTYYIDDGIIQVTTSEAADKELVSKVYPIQDLLFQPTDYVNAPDLSLQNATQGQQGGSGSGSSSGGGSSIFSGAGSSSSSSTSSATDQKTRADEIIKLITDTVKPELWQINGGTATITFYRGNLIVNAPRSIHDMLESH